MFSSKIPSTAIPRVISSTWMRSAEDVGARTAMPALFPKSERSRYSPFVDNRDSRGGAALSVKSANVAGAGSLRRYNVQRSVPRRVSIDVRSTGRSSGDRHVARAGVVDHARYQIGRA